MSERKTSRVAGILIVVAVILAMVPWCVPWCCRVLGQDAYSAFGQFFEKFAPVYGFLPVYLLLVARTHAKKNGQDQLAALSLVLMAVAFCMAMVWVIASIVLPGMMA
jgi:hypothetical protein